MNTALKMKLEEMNRRLNEALDTDLFEESESEFNEFQAEVDSFERELEEISEFRQNHLQLSELKKIGDIQKKIRQVKNGYNFYDPEYERSVMFPNGVSILYRNVPFLLLYSLKYLLSSKHFSALLFFF